MESWPEDPQSKHRQVSLVWPALGGRVRTLLTIADSMHTSAGVTVLGQIPRQEHRYLFRQGPTCKSFFHLSFPSRFRSPPVCTWRPRIVFFSFSCSDALPGSPSSSKEQFSFLWEDYGLFPNPRDPTAGSNGMNITVKVLSPLDPQGEFAPVQEAFTTTV